MCEDSTVQKDLFETQPKADRLQQVQDTQSVCVEGMERRGAELVTIPEGV